MPVYSQQMDVVKTHKDLIELLKWDENPSIELVQAFKCELNQGVFNKHVDIYPLMANIYVDDILGASAFKKINTKAPRCNHRIDVLGMWQAGCICLGMSLIPQKVAQINCWS
jgi:hypothetical protein